MSETQKDEFFLNTKYEKGVNTINDTSKVSKYKKRKSPTIIVFPEIKNKKNKNNYYPESSKDVENSKGF